MKNILFIALAFVMLSSFKHPGYQVGNTVTDFSLPATNGKTVSLADYKDAKGFIVVFTCNHCPFAKKYETRINDLNKKYEKLGYPVIAINPNDAAQYEEDNFENMKKNAKAKKFTFPYLHDESQAVAKAYGATKTPDIFVIQKENGKLVLKYTGAIDDNTDSEKDVKEKYVEKAIDALLGGKAVETASTKAVGCSIKWKKA
jgi:peroxiredoxin